ncbi:MAG TPA: GntR family transcriptional regulator [Microbacteriaceae bacterium]|nr:GntR family transcriptional regulator [Microbacteriaceae bacterium]
MSAPGEDESEAGRVTRLIRDEILDRVLEPGSPLVERELAARHGVSRIPVRDALRTLVGEGLVTPRPRTWSIVRTFTPDEIADLHEVRAAIETLAFRLATQRHTARGIEELRRVVSAELAAARQGDAIAARRAAADFHDTVVALAGNAVLEDLERSLRSRMHWLLGRYDDLERVAHEHEALYAAIARRDEGAVGRLLERHMGTGKYLDGTARTMQVG